jgi:hypothetical protein
VLERHKRMTEMSKFQCKSKYFDGTQLTDFTCDYQKGRDDGRSGNLQFFGWKMDWM